MYSSWIRAIRSSVRPNTGQCYQSRVTLVSSRELTCQALAIFRVPVKVLPVGDHAASQVGHREGLFLIVPLVAFRDSFNVGSHGPMNALNA